MNSFNSYQKIPEYSGLWTLDEKDAHLLRTCDWCVTEKIHGANFCWVVTATEILCAKRKAVLAETDAFFNYQIVKERLGSTIRQVFDDVIAEKANVTSVYIYGELFGGDYPHKDVPLDPRVTPVQTGIFYSPTIEFCAFDIATDNNGLFEYLNFDEVTGIFEQSSLFYAKPLFIGGMEDALEWPIRFTTTIPPLLNLPALDLPNYAEGVVIKPVKNIQIQSKKGPMRPIIKKKIKEFSEDHYHQAEKWIEPSDKKYNDEYILDEIEWDINMLVTANRLNNAISKVGSYHVNTADEIQDLLKQDVWDELTAKYGERLKNFNTEDLDLIKSVIQEDLDKIIVLKFG